MGDIFGFVGTMLEPIRDFLCTYIGRQLGYLVHCKRNIKDFADEVGSLILEKGRIQIEVEAALNNAEVIHDDVREWLSKVQSMEDEKTRLLQGKQNLKCLDVRSRYRLGKEGKNKKTRVTKLIEDGNNFRTVGHRPPLTRTWHRTHTINYESFESRELVFEEIMKALKDDASYKIGIHGMPGVGKTRMMQEVAQQAENKGLFDEIAKIVVSQNPILKDIQLKLAASLNLKLDKDTTEYERKELLRSRLENGKKIFVMVDDVWNDQIKLEDIGIPATNDHTKGCKILLTSRNRDVFEAMEVPQKVNFQIGVLSETEAWSLFNKKVGDSIQPHGMRSVAKAVCEECAGLPLAILAVGGALKNKSKQVWEDALKQLKSSTAENIAGLPAKLYSPIELSYNHLELVDAKSLFLLCCLFPEDIEIPIDWLMMFGFGMSLLQGVDTIEEARNRTHALVTTLKTASLLLEVNEEDKVKMHDVIRDVAISIASKDKDVMFLVKVDIKKWSEKDEYKRCRAISLWLNHDCVIPDDLECPELRTLMLLCWGDLLDVPCSFLKGMEKLVVLFLHNVRIATLPSSLKNLRILGLLSCKLVNRTYFKEFKKLEILGIADEDLEEVAPEIGQLSHLQALDLRGCKSLKILPSGVISSLSQLEELCIPDEFDQWEIKDNASLNELNSLTRLISLEVHVPNVELLPLNDELLFKSLIRFKISIGSKFYFLDAIPSSKKRILKLVGFPLKKRERELKILMEKAQVLILKELKGLKDVFDDRYGEEGFQELEYLQVEDCDDEMEDLLGKPKWINSQSNQLCASGGSFSKLRELKVTNCRLMKYLFSAATARGLPQLQRLCINNCEMLEEIVGDFEQEKIVGDTFHQLKRMELRNLRNLRSFYGNTKKKMSSRGCNTSTLAQALFNDKVRLPVLEELMIDDLKSLTTIWDNELFLDSFQQLRNINVRKCRKLVNVIPSNALSLLQNLEILEVEDCDLVVSVVEVIVTEEGDDGIIVFPQLKNVRLELLRNLKSFCWSRRGGEDRVPKENNITQQQALFSHKIRLPALEELNIMDLESLTAIWDNELFLGLKGEKDSFQRLRKINVQKCQKLVNVIPPNVLPLLQDLEILKVSMVPGIEVIATKEGGDEIVMFPRLKTMRLEILPNLKSFCWSGRGEEDSVLEENNIPQQQALFNNKIRFPALEELKINDLESLTTIWDNELFLNLKGEDSFQRLRNINVQKCHKLVNIIPPNVLPLLQGIEILEVSTVSIVEVIVTEEGSDGIVVFPRLKTMRLEILPNLKSFCWSGRGGKDWELEENNIPQQQALFNHKVEFRALEKLEIKGLGSLTAIWNDPLQSVLQELTIRDCEMLEEIISDDQEVMMNTISFHQLKKINLYRLPNLRSFYVNLKKTSTTRCNTSTLMQALFNHKVVFPALEKLEIEGLGSLTAIWNDPLQSVLQKLTIRDCEMLEKIISDDQEVMMNTVSFHQLKKIELSRLPNLRSFYVNLKKTSTTRCNYEMFNHKVKFPALEELNIYDLKSLTAIWDNELFSSLKGEDSFRRLRSINVQKCHKLVNVFPPNALPLLEGLKILEVRECDSVVYGVDIVATEEGGDEIVVFSRLKTMRLEFLPNFKSLCWSKNNILLQQEALFNHKFEFPMLEQLACDGSIFEGIWVGHLRAGSFRKVRVIEMTKYSNIMNDCRQLLQWFEVVEKLSLKSCYSLEVIFNLEGVDDALQRKAIIDLSSQLQTLTLEDLPKLNHIWITDSGGLLMFHNLRRLSVEKCNSLRYLFSLSIARRLTQLKYLKIEGCDAMEEIVVKNEEQGEEEDSTNEIVFPNLWILELASLPKLTSFCGANNAAFKFPSLKFVGLQKCPELQTFASGGISTPPNIYVMEEGSSCKASELNKYVEQQYDGKGKTFASGGISTPPNIYVMEEGSSCKASEFERWIMRMKEQVVEVHQLANGLSITIAKKLQLLFQLPI